jgi:hypothetical protein
LWQGILVSDHNVRLDSPALRVTASSIYGNNNIEKRRIWQVIASALSVGDDQRFYRRRKHRTHRAPQQRSIITSVTSMEMELRRIAYHDQRKRLTKLIKHIPMERPASSGFL